jgi:hypothetical protein
MSDTISPTHLKINKGIRKWSAMARQTDIVFCKHIGEVLQAVVIGRGTCCMPPRNCDILVSVFRSLVSKFNVHGKTNGEQPGADGYRWDITTNPFVCSLRTNGGYCDGKACWQSRLQSISPRPRWRVRILRLRNVRTQTSSRPSIPIPWKEDGGICFGIVGMSQEDR